MPSSAEIGTCPKIQCISGFLVKPSTFTIDEAKFKQTKKPQVFYFLWKYYKNLEFLKKYVHMHIYLHLPTHVPLHIHAPVCMCVCMDI